MKIYNSTYFSVLPGSLTTVNKCPNANEKWLIKNRLNNTDINDKEILCGKHRSKYGIGYKDTNTCSYPKHKNIETRGKKRTKREDFRMITAQHLRQISE